MKLNIARTQNPLWGPLSPPSTQGWSLPWPFYTVGQFRRAALLIFISLIARRANHFSTDQSMNCSSFFVNCVLSSSLSRKWLTSEPPPNVEFGQRWTAVIMTSSRNGEVCPRACLCSPGLDQRTLPSDVLMLLHCKARWRLSRQHLAGETFRWQSWA